MATEYGDVPIVFGHPDQRKALSLSSPKARYSGFSPGRTVLRKGLVKRTGCLALPCDMIFDKDVAVKLRDGCTIYIDVYRPMDTETTVPGILAWSPYGKDGGGGNQTLDDFPFRMGVPLSKVSETQKWEGPDPAYWVPRGYAVVNADPRGVNKSEGNIYHWGTQEGRDGADTVDWIGQQPWCNGKVAMAGNSWLAITQWFIAAEQPKHLTCIAPWEGLSDFFSHFVWRGGPTSHEALNFNLKVASLSPGENSWENISGTVESVDNWSAYHEDKRARIEDINVPAYVVASYNNPVHAYGTFASYAKLRSKKWLRVHDSWEWPDLYDDASAADLYRFFEYHLKDVENGWNTTMPVRTKILDTAIPYPQTGSGMELDGFPSSAVQPVKLYFNPSQSTLSADCSAVSQVQYESSKGSMTFQYQFHDDVVLCGPVEVSLAVSIIGGDDADVFVEMRKISAGGKTAYQLKVPFEKWYQQRLMISAWQLGLAPAALFYYGPTGGARVSRRTLNEEASTPGFPTPRYGSPQPVKKGEVVRLTPAMTPIGMRFSKGEFLEVRISGKDPTSLPPMDAAVLEYPKGPHVNDTGRVSIHCGTESYVTLPVVSGRVVADS